MKNVLLGNRLPVNCDPLAKIDQVRRSVFPDLESLGTEQSFARCDDAALTIRSSNVNRREPAVGGADFGEKSFGAVKTWFYAAGGAGEKCLDRLAIRRQDVVHPAEAGLPLI